MITPEEQNTLIGTIRIFRTYRKTLENKQDADIIEIINSATKEYGCLHIEASLIAYIKNFNSNYHDMEMNAFLELINLEIGIEP